MEIIFNTIANMHNPYIFLIISIICSLTFGIYGLNAKYEVLPFITFSLYIIAVTICVLSEMLIFPNLAPMDKHSARTVWSGLGFCLTFLLNGLVLLLILLWHIRKNSIKYVTNNKIIFNRSFLLGAITTFFNVGIAVFALVGMGLMEELVSFKGPLALLYLIPLIVSFILAQKSHSWIMSLLRSVVRKNLPKDVRQKLVGEQ
ncbi:hypothetical protein [Lactobacillus sp. PV034]|uniref:hypothetical protein n=1 Tax=Lactobacillus sp. PV034 TaxID=2594495 RepID=UPI002240DE17|nr:hypothetical protein [Lactobacillus sp. PV034]QNQ80171.1 hypothetical protein FP432_00680 [Lactobacillus sp. PV034]